MVGQEVGSLLTSTNKTRQSLISVVKHKQEGEVYKYSFCMRRGTTSHIRIFSPSLLEFIHITRSHSSKIFSSSMCTLNIVTIKKGLICFYLAFETLNMTTLMKRSANPCTVITLNRFLESNFYFYFSNTMQ